MQNELAALSTDSSHVMADLGGHHLHHDNSELVANVLTNLIKQARSAGQKGR